MDIILHIFSGFFVGNFIFYFFIFNPSSLDADG